MDVARAPMGYRDVPSGGETRNIRTLGAARYTKPPTPPHMKMPFPS